MRPPSLRTTLQILIITVVTAVVAGPALLKMLPQASAPRNYPKCLHRSAHPLDVIRATLPDPLVPVVSAYLTRHALVVDPASDLAPASRKTIILSARAGLGNRVLSTVSAFVLALVTDRALLIEWTDVNVHDVFCLPPGIEWDYTLWRQRMVQSGYGGYGSWLPSKLCVRDWCLYPPSLPWGSPGSSAHLEIEGRVGESDVYALLGCKGGSAAWDNGHGKNVWHAQHVFVTANQYFVPLLFEHPEFGPKLRKWFPDGQVASALVPFLFHPVDPVANAVKTYADQFFVPGNTLGLQVRSAPAYYCIDNLYDSKAAAAADITATMVDCVDKVIPRGGGSGVVSDPGSAKLFVASMHRESKATLMRTYGPDRVLAFGGVAAKSDDVTVSDTRNALVDILLLSQTDGIVASPLSTFAYVASAYGRNRLISVRVDLPSPFADETLDDVCVIHPQSPLLEPCFHAETAFSVARPMPQCLDSGLDLPEAFNRLRATC